MTEDDDTLIQAAQAVRRNAYAPYSGYFVGAAVRDEAGRMHVGCNVENAAFPQGSCAEQNAIGAMIAAGGRRISVIAIVGGRDAPGNCVPCGGCRQRICEFADEDTRVLLVAGSHDVSVYGSEDLLPKSFRLPK